MTVSKKQSITRRKPRADGGQRSSRGSANANASVNTSGRAISIVAIVVSVLALIIVVFVGALGLASDRSRENEKSERLSEMSQWADLTYSREVRVDAKLEALGINAKQLFGPIPKPPSITRQEKADAK